MARGRGNRFTVTKRGLGLGKGSRTSYGLYPPGDPE